MNALRAGGAAQDVWRCKTEGSYLSLSLALCNKEPN